MSLHRILAFGVAIAGVGLAGPTSARGAFELRLPRIEESFDPVYEYFFDIFLKGVPGETFVAGEGVEGSSGPDFFTIYDVRGLASPTQVIRGFLPTIQEIGIKPQGQDPPPPFVDDPNIRNVSFTFFPTRATIELPEGVTELFVGTVAIQTFDIPPPPQLELLYSWQTSRRVFDPSTGQTTIVKETGFSIAAIPEPATVAMLAMGLGLGVVPLLLRRRRSGCSSEPGVP